MELSAYSKYGIGKTTYTQEERRANCSSCWWEPVLQIISNHLVAHYQNKIDVEKIELMHWNSHKKRLKNNNKNNKIKIKREAVGSVEKIHLDSQTLD